MNLFVYAIILNFKNNILIAIDKNGDIRCTMHGVFFE